MPIAPPGKVADEGTSAVPPASGVAARGVKANVGSGVRVALGEPVPVALDDVVEGVLVGRAKARAQGRATPLVENGAGTAVCP
jgi:hypothetical protein